MVEHGDETCCVLVSSRGLLKSASVRARDPKSSVRRCQDHHDTDPDRSVPIVYVCSSALGQYHRWPERPFVLVSGDCDETMPEALPSWRRLADNPLLVRWLCQNWTGSHPKVFPMPIGMDYHTLSAPRRHEWGPRATPAEQEALLLRIRNAAPANRRLVCYANFQFQTATRYGQDRIDALRDVPAELVLAEEARVPREEAWRRQSQCAFVLSPHGGGLDCHRTWEALCLGCVPIVRRSALQPLYEGLPVLVVDSWADVTAELLAKTWRGGTQQQPLHPKLTLQYWKERMEVAEE